MNFMKRNGRVPGANVEEVLSDHPREEQSTLATSSPGRVTPSESKKRAAKQDQHGRNPKGSW